jgi:hypothetical protein
MGRIVRRRLPVSRYFARHVWPKPPPVLYDRQSPVAGNVNSRLLSPVRAFGRSLQLLVLGLLPLSIFLELTHAITQGQMLMMLVAAACAFAIGRILEGYAR